MKVTVNEQDSATMTIVNPNQDTTGKTVRFYIGERPFEASDERGSVSGGPQGEAIAIPYDVPSPGRYQAEIVIDDGGTHRPWVKIDSFKVNSWEAVPKPQ